MRRRVKRRRKRSVSAKKRRNVDVLSLKSTKLVARRRRARPRQLMKKKMLNSKMRSKSRTPLRTGAGRVTRSRPKRPKIRRPM